ISGTTAIVGAYGDDDNGAWSGSAYLFDAAAPGNCPGDLDDSNDVGVKDLLFLLGAWGPCPKKGDCPADFDGSGDVGVKDLLILLGNWGPCP
ncbi:MAG: FG-GAP repeat protein, partial [Planctomycetes bacterium]|nr:FG-GAP repeat protein [Planctomycetota bacterium]